VYKLFTDVMSDLPLDYVRQHQLEIIPLSVSVDGEEYILAADSSAPGCIQPELFYQRLRAGAVAKSSQANAQEIIRMMRPFLEAGQDILYIAFSSGLSGTYASGMAAKEQLDREFPERRVIVVDSLSASLGQGMLVHLAVERKKAGAQIDQLAQYMEDTKLRIHHWFTVDDLNFLRRGGRVSGAAAFIGTMLSIKPVLNVDDEGHLIPKAKQQGRKRALRALVEHLGENCADPQSTPIMISHGDALKDAESVAALIEQQWGRQVTLINTVNPVIGCHSGPGTIALFFVGDKPRG
jgi:DegV family protein with EDD domain